MPYWFASDFPVQIPSYYGWDGPREKASKILPTSQVNPPIQEDQFSNNQPAIENEVIESVGAQHNTSSQKTETSAGHTKENDFQKMIDSLAAIREKLNEQTKQLSRLPKI